VRCGISSRLSYADSHWHRRCFLYTGGFGFPCYLREEEGRVKWDRESEWRTMKAAERLR
jgi:hypothetical protein